MVMFNKINLKMLKQKKQLNNFSFYKKNKFKGILKLEKEKYKKEYYILYIKSSLRGFYVNISRADGKVLKIFSSGQLGYKKAQRYNPFNLFTLANEVLNFLKKELKEKKKFKVISKIRKSKKNIKIINNFGVVIVLKGFNFRRGRFVKRFIHSFLKKSIISVVDLTDLPYNGCRPKKLRRK